MNIERRLENIELQEEITKRPVNPGAEKWIGRPIPVLDHGFVYLVDYMGDDQSVEQAARASFGEGTRTTSETEGLVRSLRRRRHTTPFEMVEFKFYAKMPIFVARQWVRHRTANINEYSGRYSILEKEFYIPEPEVIAEQSKSDKQGREWVVSEEQADVVRKILIEDALRNYAHYEELLNDDGEGSPLDPTKPMVARELARMDLTLNYYTQWYWKIDLHNLFHFLKLRMDHHAQWEIRQYANAMGEIVKDSVPIAWEAFEDYEKEATYFSRFEKNIISKLLKDHGFEVEKEEVLQIADEIGLKNKRERGELVEKFESLGIIRTSEGKE